MSNELTNYNTGERINLQTATDYEVSHFLSDIIIAKKRLEDAEKAIKDHIKGLNLQWDAEGKKAPYGIANVRKSFRNMFSTSLFDKKASEEEKQTVAKAEDIKKKYSALTEIITIGR